MEESLKQLMQELGNAINDSLSESDRIAEAIGQIKRAGYDVFLVLEATIGFNKRGDEDEDESVEETEETAEAAPGPKPERPLRRTFEGGKVKFTSQDQRFLRALKISVEEDPRN
jgi:hypothetical protein